MCRTGDLRERNRKCRRMALEDLWPEELAMPEPLRVQRLRSQCGRRRCLAVGLSCVLILAYYFAFLQLQLALLWLRGGYF